MAKAKDKMIKPLAHPRGGIIGRDTGVSSIKPPRPSGIAVSPLKKTPGILMFGLTLVIKRLCTMKTF